MIKNIGCLLCRKWPNHETSVWNKGCVVGTSSNNIAKIHNNNNWLYIFAWMTINKTVHKTYKIYGSQSPHRHFWWKEHLLYFSCWCKKRETFFSIYLEKRSFFSQFFVVRKAKLFYKLITRYFRRLMADNLSSSWEKEKKPKRAKRFSVLVLNASWDTSADDKFDASHLTKTTRTNRKICHKKNFFAWRP